jgi:tetratricopeptide (TPR) repeat protein/TolB-like protein
LNPDELALKSTMTQGERVPTARPVPTTLGRYTLLEPLGEGAMGVVYAAYDPKLERTIALKILKHEPGDRLLAEARAMARLAHPNVVAVHDVGVEQGQSYIAMERVDGQTLSAWLATPRGSDELIPLLCAVGRALAAAHAAGLVHRDFKPSNVLVDRQGRPRVGDFGLALDPTAGGSGEIAGTPAYMAPEQADGRPIDARADQFAYCVTFWEALHDTRPFGGTTPPEVQAEIARGRPRHGGRRAPRWLERILLRGLATHPDHRFASMDALLAAIEARRRRRKVVAGALAAASLVGVALVARTGLRAGRPTRPAVAVMVPVDHTGRAEVRWMGTAVAEMLASELAAGERLRLVAGDQVARATAGAAEPKGAQWRLGRTLGADWLVEGSILAPPGAERLRIDLRLYDTHSGELVTSVADSARPAELADAVGRLGNSLRARLGVAATSSSEEAAFRATVPRSEAAAQLYAEGLALLRRGELIVARDRLLAAARAEPDFPMTHAALADAWSRLGHDPDAAQAARRALDLAGPLSRRDRLLVEARWHESAHAWEQAAQTYRSLTAFFPDDLDYGVALARVLTRSGRPADALATLDALRRGSREAAGDARLDLAEADAAKESGDFPRQLAAAQRAARSGAERGSRLVEAEARLLEGWAQLRLGAFDAADAVFGRARALAEQAGDRAAAANARHSHAVVQLQRGDAAATIREEQAVLPILREIGDRLREVWSVNVLAWAQQDLGQVEQALANYRAAQAIAHEIGAREEEATALENIGSILESQGDLPGAIRALDAATEEHQAVGQRYHAACGQSLLGQLRAENGDVAGALVLVREATRSLDELGAKMGEGMILLARCEVERLAGDLATARRSCERARAAGGATALDASIALGRVALDEGHPEAAGPLAESTAREAASKRRPVEEALAWSLAARAALARGDTLSAREAIERGQQQAARVRAVLVQQELDLSAAVLAGDVRALRRLSARATSVALRLSGRLLLVELLARRGEPAAAEEARALAAEARVGGFAAIERRASEISRR